MEIFQQVLPEKPISIQDNFFEIGLSSLDLAAFQEKLDEHYPGVVDITDLFDYSTVSAVAQFIDTRLEKN